MKRVLITRNFDIGLYNFNLELIEWLIDLGYEIILVLPYGERIEEFIKLGCTYIKLDFSRRGTNPFDELKLICAYKRIYKAVKPDIVLSYTIKPNIYSGFACKSLHIPHIPNITGLGTTISSGGFAQNILILFYKLAFAKVKTLFFQNESDLQFFYKYKIALNKHKLLPGSGVNVKHFYPLEYPDENTTEFVFISRIIKEKGIDEYLYVAEKLHSSKLKFHICGFCESNYESKLKDLNSKGVIIYHGMLNDVREILKKVHCLVHPTYYPEGMSNVLLEACACARPIITTNRPGCREIIDEGINGFFAKEKNGDNLIEKIKKFIAIPYKIKKQMGLAGRDKVEKEFNRDIVITRYMEEINR